MIKPRPCPVCNSDSFEGVYDIYDICFVCKWVDELGASGVSLNEAIENYKNYGICDLELL